MKVYVLYRYWDTPDNEGNEIMGVYQYEPAAQHDMLMDAQATKAYYSSDFWMDDMTWNSEREIHLGYDPMNGRPATIYCWEIAEMEVQ